MKELILPMFELSGGLLFLCGKEAPRGFPLYTAILLIIWGHADMRAALEALGYLRM